MTEPHRVGPIGDTVRHNIRRLREQQHLHQRDVSAKLRAAGRPMLATVVSKTERGERRIDVDDLIAFAAVLGVTPAQLLEPPTDCDGCRGTPPPGFACRACGAEA
ncbi:helix-turn-helix domain-containing protein [Streptomyces mirabilis]|uniref:helix-turn-helix domain-containing protein n=1 Tax=Streptomyces mirabilis TaxID=68239 RepID=UPI00368FB76B